VSPVSLATPLLGLGLWLRLYLRIQPAYSWSMARTRKVWMTVRPRIRVLTRVKVTLFHHRYVFEDPYDFFVPP
jgi:hypothetical protein